MTQAIRRGGCACGQLTFVASGEPDRVGICHCLTCRKSSGSAFSLFVVYARNQVSIQGRHEGWESSPGSRRCFCPTCGSQVFETGGHEIEIRGGAFDEPNAVTPAYEVWTLRREHWLPPVAAGQHSRNRGDGA
jgi:hypothetical protein